VVGEPPEPPMVHLTEARREVEETETEARNRHPITR